MIADLNRTAPTGSRRRDRADGGEAIGIAMDVTDEDGGETGIGEAVKGLRHGRHPGHQRRHPDRQSARGVPLRRLEEDARDPSRRRLPDHEGGAARTCTRQSGGSIIYMGSVHSKEASLLKAPYVTAKHGLIGLAQGRGQGGRQARRARQRHLPRLRAHAAGREADPRAGEGTRHHRGARSSRR